MIAPRYFHSVLNRWLKFNAVGAMGICVQLAALFLFDALLEAHLLLATALAVEAAVLHNFFWHELFTWPDRRARGHRNAILRLLAFNLTTGTVSIAGNSLLVSLLIEYRAVPLVAANLISIAACSLANFILNDELVFRTRVAARPATPRSAPFIRLSRALKTLE